MHLDRLKAIPIDQIILQYGVEFRGSAPQLKTDCVLPSHPKSQHRYTLSVNTEKGKFKCFDTGCGGHRGGDGIDFVRLMDGLDIKGACQKLATLFSTTSTRKETPKQTIQQDSTSGNRPLDWEFGGLNHEHPLIQEKGITAKTAKEFGVGYYESRKRPGIMHKRIVFPLWENEAIVGYAGRATVEGQEPKWLLPPKLVKSFLYGLELCNPDKPVVIVEGCWEVLKFWQMGIQAAALLGSSMTEMQERCLEPFGVIWLMLDDDEPGRAATQRITQRLKGKHRILTGKLKE